MNLSLVGWSTPKRHAGLRLCRAIDALKACNDVTLTLPGDPTSHGRHCRRLCAEPSPLHDTKWMTPNMQHATRRAACNLRAGTPPGVQHATRHAACHQQAACDQCQHATRRQLWD